jgi:hypothetical protein
MKLHLRFCRTHPSHRETRFCLSILATLFACAALFAANQSAAQSRIGRDIGGSEQDAANANPLVSSASATPAETDISAPVPRLDEAGLVSPVASPFLSLAQNGGQSSSSQSSSSIGGPAKSPAAKTKPPHHGLGVALAIVGSATLAVGIAAYALGGIDICANEQSGGCKEARDAGLVLMPVGAGVAATGFYFTFHH